MNVKELYDNVQFMGENVPDNIIKIKAKDLCNLLRLERAKTSTPIIDETLGVFKQQLARARANRYHKMCTKIVAGNNKGSIGICAGQNMSYGEADIIGKMEVEIV